MLDLQINGIFKAIDDHLRHLKRRMSSKRVVSGYRYFLHVSQANASPPHQTHFVLSGGLGSSQYVQNRILQRYRPEGYRTQILISNEP